MPATADKLRLSAISPGLVQSEIRAMTVECERIGGINLAQGVCDTGVPSPVMTAAIAAIEQGYNIYTRADGIASLRTAISGKLARYNGLRADPDSQILVTSGATGAFHAACTALFDPGDEVILFEPFYGYHLNTLGALRVNAIAVPMAISTLATPGRVPTEPTALKGHGFSRADKPPLRGGALAPEGSRSETQGHDWTIDFDLLRAAITPRTRAIVINSPSNPCGKVFSRSELQAIADLALQHDLFLLTDEIYEYFLFDGTEHISPATLPGMAERTITISGLSKTFSITGWRIGYLAADPRWMPAISYFHDLVYVCAPSPFQHACAAGLLELGDSFYAALAGEYQVKRDMLCSALADAGMSPSIPAGAYYVLADASALPGATARDKARNLLRATGVAAVAGTAFFSQGRGENLLRFCFAKRDEDLERACNALRSQRLQR